MLEEELISRVVWYVNTKAKNREVIMYGYSIDIQKKIQDAGINAEKVFTGNLELLAREDKVFINEKELAHNSDKYYVILPFFLADGGITQRRKLKEFGYEEFTDYIFYPYNKDNAIAVEFDKKSELKEQIEILGKRVAELEKENRELTPASNLLKWYCSPLSGEDELSAKKRFFMNLPRSTGTLRNMQLAGIILLSKLDEVCRENNIPYWTSFGTLLGSIRHGGFIPWDDDTDVCMMRADAMRLTEIMQNDEDFYVSHIYAEFDDNLNHCVQFKFRHSNSPYCVDIFIYDYCKSLNKSILDHQALLNKLLAEDAQIIRRQNMFAEEKKNCYAELLNMYLERSRKEVGTSDTPTNYMIWAIDNFRCPELFQGNCEVSDVFPLTTVVFEGLRLSAPRTLEKYIEKKYGDIFALPSDILTHVHFRLNENEEKVLNEILEKHWKYLRRD